MGPERHSFTRGHQFKARLDREILIARILLCGF